MLSPSSTSAVNSAAHSKWCERACICVGMSHCCSQKGLIYLVVLQAMQEDVQVESGDVVSDVHVSVQRAQARQQVGKQRALRALRAEHAAAIALAHLAAVGGLHHALEACTEYDALLICPIVLQ